MTIPSWPSLWADEIRAIVRDELANPPSPDARIVATLPLTDQERRDLIGILVTHNALPINLVTQNALPIGSDTSDEVLRRRELAQRLLWDLRNA